MTRPIREITPLQIIGENTNDISNLKKIDEWIAVGTTGVDGVDSLLDVNSPPFQSPWTNDSPATPVCFRMHPKTVIDVRGVPAGGTIPSVVFVLPQSYWPDQVQSFIWDVSSGLAHRGKIALNGEVSIESMGGTGATEWTDTGTFLGAGGLGVMPFSLNGLIGVGTGSLRWYPLVDAQVVLIHGGLGAAPTGSGLTVQVNRNGSSIGTFTIAAASHTGSLTPGSPISFTVGDYFTVDINAVGSTTPGSDLVVQLRIDGA